MFFQSQGKPINRIKINPDEDPETKFYLSQLSSDIKYVRLETKPECMVDQIEKVLIDKDKIFVISHSGAAGHLFVFNETGRFIMQIGKQGRGPGEYSSVSDFTLDKENRKIYFIDSMGKLFVYDYSGKCLKTEKIASKPTGITYYNKHLIMVQSWPTYYMNNGFAVTIKALEQNRPDMKLVSRKYIKFDKLIQDILIYPNYCISSNNLNCISLLEEKFDTLYHISVDGDIEARYIFELKNKTPQNLYFVQEYNDAIKKYSGYSLIIETDNYIILRVVHRSEFYLYFISKNTGKLLKQNTNKLKQNIYNDIDGGLPFTPRGLADKNVLFSIQNPLKIKEKLENPDKLMIKNQATFTYLKNLTKDAEITDNPILVFVYLKP